jgi:hypothetical protein
MPGETYRLRAPSSGREVLLPAEAGRDLNDCPTCGRRMSALPRVVEE